MNKVLIYTTILINHENIMLSERRQGQANTLCSTISMKCFEKSNLQGRM